MREGLARRMWPASQSLEELLLEAKNGRGGEYRRLIVQPFSCGAEDNGQPHVRCRGGHRRAQPVRCLVRHRPKTCSATKLMPIIEILDEDGSDAEHVEQLLEELIKTLAESMNVPKAFQHPDWNVNDASALLAWRSTASNSINKILLAVRNSDELALDQQFASIIEIVVPFAGSGPWVNGESNKSAEGALVIS